MPASQRVVGVSLIVLSLCVPVLSLSLGCAGGARRQPPRRVRGDLRLEVIVDAELNKRSPVPVDLVLVNDEKLFEKVLALTAAEWFDQREQFRRDHAEGVDFALHSWEWVPGQKVGELRVSERSRAVAGLVFALYQSPGAHRQRIDAKRDVRIELGPDDFLVYTIE